jgi:transcription elongation GreA/GreB family factor
LEDHIDWGIFFGKLVSAENRNAGWQKDLTVIIPRNSECVNSAENIDINSQVGEAFP